MLPARPHVRAFIQARTSSFRFPGKVLAPLAGRPLVAHVIERVASALPLARIVLATSLESSDDLLADYARGLGVAVFRGALDDVVARFQACLKEHPCAGFFRICADSPLLDGGILRRMLSHPSAPGMDLVTNVFPRTFPKGQSVELISARAFSAIDGAGLTPGQREHATAYFYDNPGRFRILNIESDDPSLADQRLAIDTVEDLRRLEAMTAQRPALRPAASGR